MPANSKFMTEVDSPIIFYVSHPLCPITALVDIITIIVYTYPALHIEDSSSVLGLYKNMTHFQNGMNGTHSFHWEVLLHAINIKKHNYKFNLLKIKWNVRISV